MLDKELWQVTLNLTKGHRWVRLFLGKPDIQDVQEALQDDLKTAWNKHSGEEGKIARKMLYFKFENLQKLLEDNGLPTGEITICTYAGVQVGEIHLQQKETVKCHI